MIRYIGILPPPLIRVLQLNQTRIPDSRLIARSCYQTWLAAVTSLFYKFQSYALRLKSYTVGPSRRTIIR
jgi:hypothetical protein